MWIELGVVVGVLALVIYLITLCIRSNDNYWPSRGVTFVPSKEAGTFWELITKKKTIVGMDQGYYDKLKGLKYGGIMELTRPLLYLMDLELIKHILVKDFDHFVDRRDSGGAPEDALHEQDKFFVNMLPALKGQKWKDVRSILSPTFTTGKIRRMFKHFNNSAKGILNFVKSQPEVGGGDGKYNVIIQEVVSRFTVDVIGATAFGMETNALKDPNSIFYKMAAKVSKISMWNVIKSVFFVLFPKLAKLLRLRLMDEEVWGFFTRVLNQVSKTRETSNEKGDDFLQLIIEAKKGHLKADDGELDSFEKDAQLRISDDEKKSKFILTDDLAEAQSLMFFIVGFDTVSSLVNFAAYLMAIHQDMQERIYQEVKAYLESGEGEMEYDTVGKLQYMDMFVSEILRLYPAATRLERKCVKEYQLPGSDLKLPKDLLVCINVQGIQHDPEYYPDPGKFDPERFTPEEKAKRHPYAYLPFGAGPRNCIGMRFALMEAKVAIAYLAYHFLIEPTAKTPIPVKIDEKIGANRPVENLELQLTLRKHD